MRIVRTASGEVLGQDLGAGGRFAAGGLDSLAAVELASGIGKAVGRELPSTLAFDYPSVPEAAAHVLSLLQPSPLARGSSASAHASLAKPLSFAYRNPVLNPSKPLLGTMKARPPLVRVTSAARLPVPQPLSSQGQATAAEAISIAPLERWDLEAKQVAGAGAQPRVRFGGWLAAVETFDAAAFGVPPPEAELMDPQQRLLLEVSWEALQACSVNPCHALPLH